MAGPRIVSLVPSLTELVCSLGLGPCLVGRTGFCVHPRDELADVPKLGGTKTPMLERLRELRPTHLILNREENERSVYEQLRGEVPHVIVTFPVTLDDNRALYQDFGERFERPEQAARLLEAFDAARARLLSRRDETLRVLYLIWRKPWMTVASQTFISHMLATVGLQTVSPDRVGPQDRYPVIEEQAFAELVPDLVLLSSEPYAFRNKHLSMVQALPGMTAIPGALIDGEMTSWYGPRAIAGLDYLARFRDRLDRDLNRSKHAC